MYFCSISKPPALDEACRNSGELLVEVGGVLTLQERVRIAVVSGLRLEAERYRESFDLSPDSDEVELIVPGARRPGYDIVDAQNDLDELRERYNAARQAQFDLRNKAAAEAAAKAFAKALDEKVEAEIVKRGKPAKDSKESV